ncbi:MAG: Ycf66 family protein [Nostocaceae cyanobacterium]|nr:Ycf66 family protein [Nostocaceae cyanobacterium]
MLAYVLAFAIGVGSILFYVIAFLFPEIHRKNDFIWSGVGFFYALVLWVFARRITGGLLLGHIASVALLGWLGWQTLSLRQQLTPKAQQTPVPSSEAVQAGIQEQVTKLSLPQRLGQIATSLGGIFSGLKGGEKKASESETKESVGLDKAAIDAIADADSTTTLETVAQERATTETAAKTETPTQATPEVTPVGEKEAETPTQATPEVTPVGEKEAETPTQATPEVTPVGEIQAETPTEQPKEAVTETTETETEAIPPNPPSAELEADAQPETEAKNPPPVAEIAPDAELAPPAEPPATEKPPSTPGES